MVLRKTVAHIRKLTVSRRTNRVLRLLQTLPSSVSAPHTGRFKHRLTGFKMDRHRDRPIDRRHRKT